MSRYPNASLPAKISAIVPTRDRPQELLVAVESILRQDRPPDELIVVDQSAGTAAKRLVESAVAESRLPLRLVYVHDPSIPGLVQAKARGVELANGSVICFLEDDVVLERGYFSAMEDGFSGHPEMLGCCGVTTNLPPLPYGYAVAFHMFHVGIFQDPRVGVHGAGERLGADLIPSSYLSGGISAYLREVFREIQFDLQNDFFMLEDIDFSTRAAKRFGARFYINPRARLEHRSSPVNRPAGGLRQRRKLREYLVFYKKRRGEPYALASLIWLLVGLGLYAVRDAVLARDIAPVSGFARGIRDGCRWTA